MPGMIEAVDKGLYLKDEMTITGTIAHSAWRLGCHPSGAGDVQFPGEAPTFSGKA
jgi:hypothetical protein